MGEDEIGVEEGCMIQLTTGPRGGQDYGDGWWEGQFPPPLIHSTPSGESPHGAEGSTSAQCPRISRGLVPQVICMRGSWKGNFMGP